MRLQASLALAVTNDLNTVGSAVGVALNGAPTAPDDQIVTLGKTQWRNGGGGTFQRRRAGKPDGRISGHQGGSEGNAEVAKNGYGRTPFRGWCRPGNP